MYSKAAASQLRQDFWTVFGQYMTPMLSADGEKISWINYKTGIRHIRFTMQAEKDEATIAILITAADELTRALYFDQLLQLRKLLEAELGEAWEWTPATTGEHGKTAAMVRKVLPGVSVFRKEDWPALISFFKPRIIALDAFWSQVKYGFENL